MAAGAVRWKNESTKLASASANTIRRAVASAGGLGEAEPVGIYALRGGRSLRVGAQGGTSPAEAAASAPRCAALALTRHAPRRLGERAQRGRRVFAPPGKAGADRRRLLGERAELHPAQ